MDSELREDRCETCRFWDGGVMYQLRPSCHIRSVPGDRFPPRVAHDWCGEWEPKYKVTEYAHRLYPCPTVEDVMAVANAPPSA